MSALHDAMRALVPPTARSALFVLKRSVRDLAGSMCVSSTRAIPVWPHDCAVASEMCSRCESDLRSADAVLAGFDQKAIDAELAQLPADAPWERPYAIVCDGVLTPVVQPLGDAAGWGSSRATR